MSKKHLTDQRFNELPIHQSLLNGLAEASFEFCTPIQAESLPPSLSGKDVAGQAQTGTGKTIAFLVACCNYLLERPPLETYLPGQPRALILAPTRELAIQIHKDALLIGSQTGLSFSLVYGGTGYEQQKEMLQAGSDILIGTPGRLIDFYKQNLFILNNIQVTVMDEADRMFDLGFIKDLRYLLRKMPSPDQRLNLLFSATLSFRVMELAYDHLNDPMQIKIESDEVVADQVKETCYYPANEEKLPLLVNLLRQQQVERILVFVNTKHAAESVSNSLSANDISNAMLSGDVPQTKRESLLEQFKQGKRKVLVATDVAARGLHITSVSHVYNFDLPQDAEDYVHRIGRTARAGASGEAISFVCEKYAYSILEIEEYIGHSLPRVELNPSLLEPIEKAPYKAYKNASKDRPKDRRPKSHEKKNVRGEKKMNPIEPVSNNHLSAPHLSAPHLSPPNDTSKIKPTSPIAPAETETDILAKVASEPPLSKLDPGKLPARFSRRFGEVPFIG